MLLNSCKAKFDQNFSASKTKDQAKKEAEEKGVKFDEEEFIEQKFKAKHLLNGNMDFVGELFISGILRDRIAKDIFQMLLSSDSGRTDDTIEAALRFINKIGKALEDKHRKTPKEK